MSTVETSATGSRGATSAPVPSSGNLDEMMLAMDVVELAPLGGQPASDFLTAKLAYKCLGYLQETERQST
jgi:hypothetical protein